MIYNPKAGDFTLGPVMEPDLQLIKAVCNLVDPKVIVEFGFLRGIATRGMIEYTDRDAHIWTYEIEDRTRFATNDPKHTLLYKNMKDFSPEDIGNKKIDLVLFDASHVLSDSLPAWEAVKPHLNKGAIILVHDTGAYLKSKYNPSEISIKEVRGDYVYHCPDEHEFLKLLHAEGYNCVNFTCLTKIRHGIAVLQKEFDFTEVHVDRKSSNSS